MPDLNFDDFYGDANAALKKARQGVPAVTEEDDFEVDDETTQLFLDNEDDNDPEETPPEEAEQIIMTEDLVNGAISQLEALGYVEGVDFLVNEDGSFLCCKRVDSSFLTEAGVQVEELS